MAEISRMRQSEQDVFSVDKLSISNTLKRVGDGLIQLPNFQRHWKWDDEHIVRLIESVGECSPIGTIMLIETGGELKFEAIPISSVELSDSESVSPEHLIMDGQQRITSLFQALYSQKPVAIRKGNSKFEFRSYYLDMDKAINADYELSDAIISVQVAEDGSPLRNSDDFRNLEYQIENGIFPLNQIFKSDEWEHSFQQRVIERATSGIASDVSQSLGRFATFKNTIIKSFETCHVPVIILRRGMGLIALSKLYEKLNNSGIALDAFDLLIAKFAAQNYNLRSEWEGVSETITKRTDGLLGEVSSVMFVNTLILYKSGIEGRAAKLNKRSILALELDDFKKHKLIVIEGFVNAVKYLRFKKIFSKGDLPSPAVVQAVATVFAILGKGADDHSVTNKLNRWFWCMHLTGYLNSKMAAVGAEIVPLMRWLKSESDTPPPSLKNVSLVDSAVLNAKASSPSSRAIGLMLLDEVRDLISGHSVSEHHIVDDAYDMHHIFPVKWCKDNGIPQEKYDSVINKTPMSARTNRRIGGDAPSAYVSKIQSEFSISNEHMNSTIVSHGIDPEHLRADDFEAFFKYREEFLIRMIFRYTAENVIRSRGMTANDNLDGSPRLRLESRGVVITAVRGLDNQVIVLPGSQMTVDHNASLRQGYKNERDRLISSGLVVFNSDNNVYEVVSSLTMESPSFAGSVLSGRMTNSEDWAHLA